MCTTAPFCLEIDDDDDDQDTRVKKAGRCMQLAGRSIQRGVGSLSSVDRSTGRRLDIVEIVVARLASYYTWPMPDCQQGF